MRSSKKNESLYIFATYFRNMAIYIFVFFKFGELGECCSPKSMFSLSIFTLNFFWLFSKNLAKFVEFTFLKEKSQNFCHFVTNICPKTMLVKAIFFELRKAKLCHQLKITTIRALKRPNQHFLLVNFWHMAIEETKCNFCKLPKFQKMVNSHQFFEGSGFSNHQI
jgi:hypothetical protein